ncbi:hypothetical protein B0I35DRAFT_480812 [Stachybotrys elegans]|uniref:Uncharacterized protein n=1 Tax=Stachybotrys elegans TaxID=80388 RepID=A0A8K0SQH1_9HYPO|nr:hypothetical protein B0I35DRAFT_480812 [Stachybotrys elegans]
MTPSRDPVRLRQGLNPLTTTSLGHFVIQHNTPMSAVSMATTHAVATPASAIQPYNPQEWVASPATQASERLSQHYGADAPAAANAPLPPPPYSPPRSQRPRPTSGSYESSPASATTSSRVMSPSILRPSPETPANPSFPPPPGAAGRGPSRERRFGIPSLRRRDHDQNVVAPEPHHPSPLARQSTSPLVLTSVDQDRNIQSSPLAFQSLPPASRRAASTGAIDTPTSARSRSASQTGWESGMPLPPPPPGPPPSGSRSQSMRAMDRTTAPVASPPTRRPPPEGISTLGPVPPTPANWVDSDHPPRHASRERSPALTIDTSAVGMTPHGPDATPSSSSAGGLNRARAVRHDKTILQRRTESRNRQGSHGSIDERTNPQFMSDIVVPADAGGLASKLLSRTTPRSGGRSHHDVPRTGESSTHPDSRNSTPRAMGSARLPMLDTGTPPFSPYAPSSSKQPANAQTSVPKALPTPPPQTRSASVASRSREHSRPPISLAASTSKQLMVSQTAETFAEGAIERFRAFAAKEAVAGDDADRVRLFADFIVSESRIRRERYSAAIGAMGSEIFDLTRDLFRPMAVARRESNASQGDWTPATTDPTHSQRNSFISNAHGEGPSTPGPSSAKAPASPSTGAVNNGNWATNYMPSLSPILSMSVSDNYENGSSRGRPSSRWWETDSQGAGGRGLERSKRESKYMGVPKEHWAEGDAESGTHGAASEHSSSTAYPPEKVGWHESQDTATPQLSRFSNEFTRTTSSPALNHPDQLDVSRLVTMPPPYPRHHPAVNNNHPELTETRIAIRSLSDLAEVDEIKRKFTTASSKRREDFTKAAAERRQALRANLQREIQSGSMGYADAAAIEQHSVEEERAKTKEMEKSEYEKFQNDVIVPLNDLLTGRITRATELFDSLSQRLFDNAQNEADMPQEEGDDRPELLEKLTLLKWIFEARETLHRAIYDVLSDRNGRYRDVVLTPYRLSGNTEKLQSAEAFFAEDAAKREYAFAIEVMNRTREFRTVVEEAVDRGVALQLSAFWDIAPPLTRVLDSIPMDLQGFSIQIPLSEFDENPSYHRHPLQYLFSLLLHAEKSTYQFIEAHTNLLCLLHQVKEAVVHAKAKVLATQLEEVDGTPVSPKDRETRSKQMREAEEARLTEDLKEKVRLVQEQWNSALGEGFKGVKERTGEWLLQTGGWDETLEDGGVGGV